MLLIEALLEACGGPRHFILGFPFICHPIVCVHVYIFESTLTHTCTWYIKMYLCSTVVLLWRVTRQRCCIVLWECIYPAFGGEKHDLFVISESSITYMVLYSIYLSALVLFFNFVEALKWLYTQHGALIRLTNEGTRIERETTCLISLRTATQNVCFILRRTAVLYK